LHGLHQDQGVLWLVQRYRLQAALMLFWATLLVFAFGGMSGDLVATPDARPGTRRSIRHGEGAGVAARRLLQRSIASEQVVAEMLGTVPPSLAAGCAGYFCRSTLRPAAARRARAASSSGLQGTTPADRRAPRIRKGSGSWRPRRPLTVPTASPKTIPEETRIT